MCAYGCHHPNITNERCRQPLLGLCRGVKLDGSMSLLPASLVEDAGDNSATRTRRLGVRSLSARLKCVVQCTLNLMASVCVPTPDVKTSKPQGCEHELDP